MRPSAGGRGLRGGTPTPDAAHAEHGQDKSNDLDLLRRPSLHAIGHHGDQVVHLLGGLLEEVRRLRKTLAHEVSDAIRSDLREIADTINTTGTRTTFFVVSAILIAALIMMLAME